MAPFEAWEELLYMSFDEPDLVSDVSSWHSLLFVG